MPGKVVQSEADGRANENEGPGKAQALRQKGVQHEDDDCAHTDPFCQSRVACGLVVAAVKEHREHPNDRISRKGQGGVLCFVNHAGVLLVSLFCEKQSGHNRHKIKQWKGRPLYKSTRKCYGCPQVNGHVDKEGKKTRTPR